MKPVHDMLRDYAVSAAEVTYCLMSWPVIDKEVAVVCFNEQSNHLSGETDVSSVLL